MKKILERPYIDDLKCIGEGICIDVCPAGVFKKARKKVVVKYPKRCIQCMVCVERCPQMAIGLK